MFYLLKPPACIGGRRRRRRRDLTDAKSNNGATTVGGILDGGTPAMIEVYSGLYVNEASDTTSKSDFLDEVSKQRVINILPYKTIIIYIYIYYK